jgi:hypothetical protein
LGKSYASIAFAEQITLKDLEFPPTILPIPPKFEGIIRKCTTALEEHGYPNTFLGSDWLEIIENLPLNILTLELSSSQKIISS